CFGPSPSLFGRTGRTYVPEAQGPPRAALTYGAQVGVAFCEAKFAEAPRRARSAPASRAGGQIAPALRASAAWPSRRVPLGPTLSPQVAEPALVPPPEARIRAGPWLAPHRPIAAGRSCATSTLDAPCVSASLKLADATLTFQAPGA